MSWRDGALARLPMPPILRTSASRMTAVYSVLATYNAGIQLGLLRKSSSARHAIAQSNDFNLNCVYTDRTIYFFSRCHLLFSPVCPSVALLFNYLLINRCRILYIFLSFFLRRLIILFRLVFAVKKTSELANYYLCNV